jgi:hypothetical protein
MAEHNQGPVELNDGDSIKDVLEEVLPNFVFCPYLNCGKRVSAYDVKAHCRYCKGIYCGDHVDYRVHGYCMRL